MMTNMLAHTFLAMVAFAVCAVRAAPISDASNIFSSARASAGGPPMSMRAMPMMGAAAGVPGVAYDERLGMGMGMGMGMMSAAQQQQEAMRTASMAAHMNTVPQTVFRPGYYNRNADVVTPPYHPFFNEQQQQQQQLQQQQQQQQHAAVVAALPAGASAGGSVRASYESYLLPTAEADKERSCVAFNPWCCGATTHILATCGSAPVCKVSLKSWGTYEYNVTNGEFTDMSASYAFKVKMCNIGEEGVVFVSTF